MGLDPGYEGLVGQFHTRISIHFLRTPRRFLQPGLIDGLLLVLWNARIKPVRQRHALGDRQRKQALGQGCRAHGSDHPHFLAKIHPGISPPR